MKQKIVFTALPNGLSSSINAAAPIQKNPTKVARLSVAISLQIFEAVENARLLAFPDMLNWASIISKAAFRIEVNGKISDASIVSAKPDLQIWNDLFTGAIKVLPFVVEDLTNVALASIPTAHIADHIDKIVKEVGSTFTGIMPKEEYYVSNPLFAPLSGYEFIEPDKGVGNINSVVQKTGLSTTIKNETKAKHFIKHTESRNPSRDFARLRNFHHVDEVSPILTYKPIDRQEYEFHQILSVLATYPALMKMLGLVIDLEFDAKLLETGQNLSSIRVLPTGMAFNNATRLVCPATIYLTTTTGFYSASPASSFHDRGFVKINTPAFSVAQIDTDGAALKLTSHIDNIILQQAQHMVVLRSTEIKRPLDESFNEKSGKESGTPSNRSAGITLIKNGMAEHLYNRFKRMNDLNSAFEVENPLNSTAIFNQNVTYSFGKNPVTKEQTSLDVEDLTMGYRMDVRMGGLVIVGRGNANPWRSLHLHNNTYSYKSNIKGPITVSPGLQEGFIQLSTSEDETVADRQMKVSEVIARWEGWSLSVPMPGFVLNDPLLSEKEMEDTDLKEQENYVPPGTDPFTLTTDPVIAPGTLPKLRFGKKYDFRLRMVDLAGNGPALNSIAENATESIIQDLRYLRYEPVDAPALNMTNNFTNNAIASSDINFRDGESSEVLVIRSNEGVEVDQYESLNAYKTQPGIFRSTSVRHVKPPRTTVNMAITHGMIEKALAEGNLSIGDIYEVIGSKDAEINPAAPNAELLYEDKVNSVLLSADEKLIPVNYLADPMAAGVAFFFSEFNEESPKGAIPSKSIFDKRCSFYFDREVISTEDANMDFDGDKTKSGDFTAWMAPKSFRIVLKAGADFDMKWSENSERTMTVTLPKGRKLKLNYASFWRPAEIINCSGVYQQMGLTSLDGSPGEAIVAGKSFLYTPWRMLTLVHAVQQPLTATKDPTKKLPLLTEVRCERSPNETVARIHLNAFIDGFTTGQVDVYASWKDKDDVTGSAPVDIDKKMIIHQQTPSYLSNAALFGVMANGDKSGMPPITQNFTDTKHRWAFFQVVASTRYKEHFYRLIEEKKGAFDLSRSSQLSLKINIPSSARPAAPQVAYVIPIFEWLETGVTGETSRGRIGGLRIYLKRPWFSSGPDERLAIILRNDNTVDTEEFMQQVCTTWGKDQTRPGDFGVDSIFPNKALFTGIGNNSKNPLFNVNFVSKLSIEESVNMTVDATTYEVKYDEGRELHYADVLLLPGASYYPFVRLALATYQPFSVSSGAKSCSLSPIVQADYIQIPSVRSTSLKRAGANLVVKVSGNLPAINEVMILGPNVKPFLAQFVIEVENPEHPVTEGIYISTPGQAHRKFEKTFTLQDAAQFQFLYEQPIELPLMDLVKGYRVKIMEYEILPDNLNNQAAKPQRRLVFSDVYEVPPI